MSTNKVTDVSKHRGAFTFSKVFSLPEPKDEGTAFPRNVDGTT